MASNKTGIEEMQRNGCINSSDVNDTTYFLTVEISLRFGIDLFTVGLRKRLGIENVPEYLA